MFELAKPLELPTMNELFAYSSIDAAFDSIRDRLPKTVTVETECSDPRDLHEWHVFARRPNSSPSTRIRIATIRTAPKLRTASTSIVWARASLIERIRLSPPFLCHRCTLPISDRFVAEVMTAGQPADRCERCASLEARLT